MRPLGRRARPIVFISLIVLLLELNVRFAFKRRPTPLTVAFSGCVGADVPLPPLHWRPVEDPTR